MLGTEEPTVWVIHVQESSCRGSGRRSKGTQRVFVGLGEFFYFGPCCWWLTPPKRVSLPRNVAE